MTTLNQVAIADVLWPKGPYRFDDISTQRADDGLGYVYFDDGGYSPTLAHTGDDRLTAEQNRALGHLFAAAPELFEALAAMLDGRPTDPPRYDPLGKTSIAYKNWLLFEKGRAALKSARGPL